MPPWASCGPRAAGWPAPEDPDGDDDAELDGRDLICDRLLDEVGWLRQCAGWLTHLHTKEFPPAVNLRPAQHPCAVPAALRPDQQERAFRMHKCPHAENRAGGAGAGSSPALRRGWELMDDLFLRDLAGGTRDRPTAPRARPGKQMSDQNSGSQSAAGTRGPRRGGLAGVPAWSAAWTAAATSCAVSASMTTFRRSSTRRTTCPACRAASCGSATM